MDDPIERHGGTMAVSLICNLNLYPAEQEKLEQLADRLTDLFVAAGFEEGWHCEAWGAGDQRTLYFHHSDDVDRPMIALKALAFLASDSAELLHKIERHLSNRQSQRDARSVGG